MKFLTQGSSWEATKLVHYDEQTGYLYYLSNEMGHGTRHLYKLDSSNGAKDCVSCVDLGYNITAEPTIPRENLTESQLEELQFKELVAKCMYFDASFGSSADWFLLDCLGPTLPFSLHATLSSDGTVETSFLDVKPNLTMTNNLAGNFWKRHIYSHYTVENEGQKIHFKMLTPRTLVKKRPVVFHIGDLGSENAGYRYVIEFPNYLASKNDIIVVFMDGRGSGNRGDNLLHSVGEQPGLSIVQDIEVVTAFIAEEKNIKIPSVGVTGTGFGAYTAILALTDENASKEANLECGAVLAPVVNWKLYSSVESEKLFGSPEKNANAYANADVLKFTGINEDKKLLVQHGLNDRLVHPQHSALLRNWAMKRRIPDSTLQFVFYAGQPHHTERWDRQALEEMYYRSMVFFYKCLYGV